MNNNTKKAQSQYDDARLVLIVCAFYFSFFVEVSQPTFVSLWKFIKEEELNEWEKLMPNNIGIVVFNGKEILD